jgi:hypothetical protein
MFFKLETLKLARIIHEIASEEQALCSRPMGLYLENLGWLS